MITFGVIDELQSLIDQDKVMITQMQTNKKTGTLSIKLLCEGIEKQLSVYITDPVMAKSDDTIEHEPNAMIETCLGKKVKGLRLYSERRAWRKGSFARECAFIRTDQGDVITCAESINAYAQPHEQDGGDEAANDYGDGSY